MKAISLFSGVGGFDLGLERAGITTVLQAERDPYCLKVLERHWPHVRRVTDVRQVSQLPRASRSRMAGLRVVRRAAAGIRADRRSGIDLVYGGFPCQDLSVAGRREGLGGERSGLWFEFHRVLRELRPRWAIVENVPGLLSSNEGRDFAVLLDGLGELGFDVAWAVLDAQHFGVPQRRRRVFIVAGPTRRGCEQVLSLCESCGGNPETSRATGEGTTGALSAGTLRAGGVNGGNNPAGGYLGDVAAAISASAGHHGHSSPRGDGSDDLVLAIEDPTGKMSGGSEVGLGVSDGPMYTLGSDPRHVHAVLANPLGAHHGRNDLDHDTYIPDVAYALSASVRGTGDGHGNAWNSDYIASHGVRRLTPLECERLQGFPDHWTRWGAEGKELADSHRYRMMGNAVCVPVAEYIGHRLLEVDRGMS